MFCTVRKPVKVLLPKSLQVPGLSLVTPTVLTVPPVPSWIVPEMVFIAVLLPCRVIVLELVPPVAAVILPEYVIAPVPSPNRYMPPVGWALALLIMRSVVLSLFPV